jgi:hypothetical protein
VSAALFNSVSIQNVGSGGIIPRYYMMKHHTPNVMASSCAIQFPILILVAWASASGQTPTASHASFKVDSYNAMLSKLKAGDTKIDFRAFRLAFAATDDASPYGSDREARRMLTLAVSEKRYNDALKVSDEILKNNYISPEVHAAASRSYAGIGNTSKAEFHKSVYLGLINSILTEGDGKTPETAYRVVAVEEEYAIMRALQYSVWGQTLGSKNGHMYDVLSATDEVTKATIKLYFNIDVVWALELKRRGQKP